MKCSDTEFEESALSVRANKTGTHKSPRDHGKLTLDAAVAEQAIRYPADLGSLNEAREMSGIWHRNLRKPDRQKISTSRHTLRFTRQSQLFGAPSYPFIRQTTRGLPKVAPENQDEMKRLGAQRREDQERIPIEGKFKQGKYGYRLNNIRATRADTSRLDKCHLLSHKPACTGAGFLFA